MVYYGRKKYTRRTPRKKAVRKYNKRTTGGTSTALARIPRTVQLNKVIGYKTRTNLRYCDTKTLDPSTGATYHKFAVNSLFDYDQTGIGHQPAYFDQWSAFYRRYRVISAKWKFKVTASPTNTEQLVTHAGALDTYPWAATMQNRSIQQIVGWQVSDTESSPTQLEAADLNFIRETHKRRPDTQIKMLRGGYKPVTLYGSCNMKNAQTVATAADEAPLISANPIDFINLYIGSMSQDGGDAWATRWEITCDFYTEFSDPIDQGTS